MAGIVAALVAPAVAAAGAGGQDATARNGRIVFQAITGTHRQLFAINPDGSGLRRLTRIASGPPGKGAGQPDWSPEGSRIAFDAPAGGGTALFTIRADGTGMRQVRVAGGGSRAAPVYSPDGRRLAFDHAASPDSRGISIVAAAGGELRRVTTGSATPGGSDTAAVWSPDGTRLAFTRTRSAGETAIHVVRADGAGLRRLTPWTLAASAASWSPDGSKILFEIYSTPRPGRSANLFTIAPGGGAMTQLTYFGGGKTHAFGPAWSPDGAKIVWHKIGPRLDQLFVMDADGANHRQLTHLSGSPRPSHPDWGPGG